VARIRSVRPETWSDSKFAALSYGARLLFIALWNYADDYGCGQYLPKLIGGFAFPHEDIDIVPLLAELEDSGRIVRYEVGGECYFTVPSWEKHQKPQNPGKRRIPSPPEPENESSPNPTESLTTVSLESTPLDIGDGSLDIGDRKKRVFPKKERDAMYSEFSRLFGKPVGGMKARYGHAVTDALTAGITPDQIAPARRRYTEGWPNAACNPQALINNWNTFGPEGRKLSIPAEIQRLYAEMNNEGG